MTVSYSSPVTGAAQTGFTSPTYTLVVDSAPDVNGKQWAVSALGGTQAGVTVHSGASPFTLTAWRPRTFRLLGSPNPTTGVISNVPENVYKQIVRKGCVPLAGQPTRVIEISGTMKIPAGAETASPAEIRAALSLFIGGFTQQAAGWGDTTVSGILG